MENYTLKTTFPNAYCPEELWDAKITKINADAKTRVIIAEVMLDKVVDEELIEKSGHGGGHYGCTVMGQIGGDALQVGGISCLTDPIEESGEGSIVRSAGGQFFAVVVRGREVGL